jgi:hypothetical protein
MLTRGARETFRSLGLDVVADPLPPGDDGAGRLLALHLARNPGLQPGAPGFAPGVPGMMNNSRLLARLAPRLGDPRRFPVLPVRGAWLDTRPSGWNAEYVYVEIRGVLEERSDADDDGFWLVVTSGLPNEGVWHAVGLEFVRRPARGAPRIFLYDPLECASAHRDAEFADLMLWGPVAMVASCPRCARAMGWDAPAPADAWGRFGTRERALDSAETAAMLRAAYPPPLPVPARVDDIAGALEEALFAMGVRAFAPRFAPQAGDDELCQTWIYVMYELRVEAGSPRAALELANASDPAAMRRRMVDFVRRAVRGEEAAAFWDARLLLRDSGGDVAGSRFLDWLRWAAAQPGFGEEYVSAAAENGSRAQ